MYHTLDKVGRGLAMGSQVVGALIALAMVLSLLLGVFYRYVLDDSLVWSNEVASLGFTWTIFLFASSLVRDHAHVRITLLIDAFPALVTEVIERGVVVLIIGFGVLMIWTGWDFTVFTAGQVSPALRYPAWLSNSAVPVSGALIVFHGLVLLLQPTALRQTGAPDHE
ncbi:TRAP transporter small permease [Marinobacter sp. C2H3]|uniref:TRAP transporter small permease n=1 Tax=Marinobacter sp. C2H3 TaxID=3119003 RepID=UPI00300EA404